jgi:hypothetical protein
VSLPLRQMRWRIHGERYIVKVACPRWVGIQNEIPPSSTIKSGDGRAAMHKSDGDLMVIISGEIWGYQSDADEGVLLRPGDTFSQRGTMHAWENRGTVPCLFAVDRGGECLPRTQ